MSADDMLAAQLWPWPDPIIKRNAQGGVIFVNAAFLQLYGGQVTDWHGCAVDGWPAPTIGHQAVRFETRMPIAGEEQVFDWLEHVTSDGGAMAISRNVTALLNQIPPQEPDMAVPVVEDSPPNIPPTQMPAIHAPQIPTSFDAPSAEMAPVSHDLAPAAPHIDEPVTHVEAVENTEADMMAAPMPIPAPETDPEPKRDFERRALPIEDDESLLGSNWRDAVIAKAVGADAPTSAPVAQEMSAIAAPETQAAPQDGNMHDMPRILLAEDNAINALLTRTLLEADGCYVEVVEDGNLAVDAVKLNKYDMILMDMRMPNMDGLEATRKIRSLSNEAKAIPIIALTANAFDDDRNACFDAGMNDFMTKPVSAEELQQMVQTWTNMTTSVAA